MKNPTESPTYLFELCLCIGRIQDEIADKGSRNEPIEIETRMLAKAKEMFADYAWKLHREALGLAV